jgi:uncharacterized protein YdeI (YjbR/CyaY-like superfamily)
MKADSFEQVEIISAQELWVWLAANHTRETGVWLVTWKAIRRDRYVSREEVLDALIAYGWIDGRRMVLDADLTMQLISPRREQTWAQTYKRRAERLEREGRMMPAGHAAAAASRKAGKWDAMAHVDRLEIPPDLADALETKGAVAWWDRAAPSYRRNVLRWIEIAKRPATRAKRIDAVTQAAALGEKVPNY